MARYAAHLMLEYGVRGVVRTQSMCERRIVVFRARNAQAAVRKAKQIGKKAEQRYRNVEGRIAETRFVGLVDVIDIDFVGPEEVYYSLGRVKNPKAAHPRRLRTLCDQWLGQRSPGRLVQKRSAPCEQEHQTKNGYETWCLTSKCSRRAA